MRVTRPLKRSVDVEARRWLPSLFELSPLRITAIYLVFGITAHVVADVLLVRYVAEPLLGQLRAVQGAAEVLLTAGLVLLLTTTKEVQVARTRERFQRQREELLVLHRVLRHNLRNDLNVIFGQSTSLGDVLDGEDDQSRCDVINRKAEKILHYTEQAERIRRVSEGGGTLVEVDLAERLPEIVEGHPLVTDDVEVRYSLPETAFVRVNRMFPEAVEEVVGNAVENSEGPGATIEVTVDTRGSGFHLTEVRIDDDGPGIPPHVSEILAESEYDQLTHLQGMGIWFVYWVVIESGGELYIDESPMGGASVVVRLSRGNVASSTDAVPTAGELLPV